MVNFDKTESHATVHCFIPNSRATYCNISSLSPQKYYLVDIYGSHLTDIIMMKSQNKHQLRLEDRNKTTIVSFFFFTSKAKCIERSH